MEFNLADLFEHAVDTFGPTASTWSPTASAAPTPRWTSGPTGSPTTSPAQGVGPGDHVGIYGLQLGRVGREPVGGLQAAGGLDQHQLPLRRGRARLPVRQRRPEGARPRRGVRRPGRRRAAPHLPDLRARRLGRSATPTTRTRWPRGRPSATSAPAPPTTATSSTPAAPRACPRAWCGATRTCFFALGGGIDPLTGERVDRARGHGRAGPDAELRRSRSCPSPRSCTAPPSGRVMGQSFHGQQGRAHAPASTPHEVLATSSSARRSTR